MKTFLTVFFSLLLINQVACLSAQTRFESKSYQVDINGTSTMHDWVSSVSTVSVSADFMMDENSIESLKNATVEMQTKSIKSKKNSSLMDSRTHSTLKADQHPKIKFVLTKVQSVKQNGSEWNLQLQGNMTIAGSSQSTDLLIKAKMLGNGEMEITGTKKLKMSTYGVKPPSFMLGALKVGDEVTINFSVKMKKAPATGSSK